MGGGTYTGIEAVCNSMNILHEPRVATGKRTMAYMAFSLAFIAGGLILAYLFFHVRPEQDRTLNAVLFDQLTQRWGAAGDIFVTHHADQRGDDPDGRGPDGFSGRPGRAGEHGDRRLDAAAVRDAQ